MVVEGFDGFAYYDGADMDYLGDFQCVNTSILLHANFREDLLNLSLNDEDTNFHRLCQPGTSVHTLHCELHLT